MPYTIIHKAHGSLRVYREKDTAKAIALFISLAQRPEPQDKNARTAALGAFSDAIVKGLAMDDYYFTYVIDERIRSHPQNVPKLPRAPTLTIRREYEDTKTVAESDASEPYHTDPAPYELAHLVPILSRAPTSHQGKNYLRRISNNLTQHLTFNS